MNSVIKGPITVGENSVISHCYLQGNITVGNGCVVSGIGPDDYKVNEALQIPGLLCLLGYNISFPHVNNKYNKVFVVFGINDNPENLVSNEASGTFCNKTWKTFFERTGIKSTDLWMHGLPEENRNLFNARLFPVVHHIGNDSDDPPLYDCLWLAGINVKTSNETMIQRWFSSLRVSLKEILSNIDLGVEFYARRQLFFDIGRRHVEAALMGGTNECFLPFLKTCAVEGFHKEILETMDNVASSSGSSMGVAARTLACIADVLGAMAGEKAGLRSGPAQNDAWKHAFQLLEDKKIEDGVKALALERSKWMDRPDLLIRAARHYEGAEQILRRHAVMTAKQFMKFEKTDIPPMDRWVIAEAPVRIDFSGGWTDTPPIAYEHGGVVTNVAIKLDGKKPLQVKAKRIHKFQIILVILAGKHSVRVVCEKLEDLADYSQPHAPGALIKACFCAANIVVLDSPKSLADQLKERYGGGFEVHSSADVPYGSGLGTSSILAGVVMGAVLRASGLTADVTSLIHAVMVVEQMLTCGGGWQDNVGGLAPGFKIASSKASLPIEVEYEVLSVSDSMVDQLNKCLVFVYTGKTRLAKNLLQVKEDLEPNDIKEERLVIHSFNQNVVRNWYGRQPNIVKVVDDLADNAKTLAKALVDGDLTLFGQCVSNYREHKKLIAPGTEPEDIRRMMEDIQPYAYGQCLAGAGGGGFLCVIAKSPEMRQKIEETLGNTKFSDEVAFHEVSIDNEGLTIRIE
ncbi:L-fucose kinase-like [Actinia tenebrosa]|uniref:L-fucose kinase-like n=1 Tax=Actinia tenebrosa TaxID=6105 RepID=A0A6P8J0C0_ACTTE|nr:L-fucose kinase-like [Actinia tenebrosa]